MAAFLHSQFLDEEEETKDNSLQVGFEPLPTGKNASILADLMLDRD